MAGEIAEDETLDETALQWEFVDGKAMRFKLRIRPVLRNVTFSATTDNDPLLEAVDLMKWAFRQKKSLRQFADFLPTYFIPDHVRRYLYGSDALGRKKLLVDRYEFLVYRLLRNGLEAGDIFCHDSVRFRSFEDDLLGEEQWRRKEELIASTGLSILQEPISEHLDRLEQLLERRQRARKPLRVRLAVQQHDRGETDHPFHRHPWKQPSQLRPTPLLRLPVRATLQRSL